MVTPVWSRRQVAIATLDDWKTHASTEGKWQEHFSAMELAKLWLNPAGPEALRATLAPPWPGLVIDEAIAEAQVPFDGYRGGVRNHDVLAYGTTDLGGVVIGVEGKVNESLDAIIALKYAQAQRIRDEEKNTNLDKRVDQLLLAVAGRSLAEDPSLGELQYQLFSAVAGTLAAAREDTVAAAVVVHLIRTPKASRKKFDATRDAVAHFAAALGLASDGPLMGPLELNAEHAHLLDVPRPVPCWLAVIETSPA